MMNRAVPDRTGNGRIPAATGILGGMPPHEPLTLLQTALATVLSVVVLGVYLTLNTALYPGYPVINEYADQSQAYTEQYPPFRMNEHLYYEIADEIATGMARQPESLARRFPIGYSLLAAPLVRRFGEIGMYYANAFIVWGSAAVFFWIVRVSAGFWAAMLWTAVLAFASPNLFFAASAYGEPLGQLFLLASSAGFLLSIANQERRRWYLALSGFTAGLQLFTIPYLVSVAGIFAAAIVVKEWRRRELTTGLTALFGGWTCALVLFAVVSLVFLGTVPFGGFVRYGYLDIFNLESMYYSGANPIVSILKLLFDSPHGVLFVMPMTMLTPLGILAMWRRGSRTLAAGTVIVLIYVIAVSAITRSPISGEAVGTRQMGALIPFLILPLAFLGGTKMGEKVWLGITVLLTVYQCTFGWWLGTARGEGVFVGILQDRAARFVILARKGRLDRPAFKRSSDLTDQFRQSLVANDIKCWFETLDRSTIDEISGFERVIFARLVTEARRDGAGMDGYILSVDPDRGIRLNIPDIFFTGGSGADGTSTLLP